MKKIIFIVYFTFFCLATNAQNEPNIDTAKTVQILLLKIKSNTISDDERKELKSIAFSLQNYGQVLDEYKHDYTGSLSFVNKAILIFSSLNDTLNEANNRKFKGYLLGRFGEFSNGKFEIEQAIKLFKSKSRYSGIAVSQFDLSRLYEFENKIDSSMYYCNTSLSYWKIQEDTSRIFGIQNMLIHLFIKVKDLEKAKTLQTESNNLSGNAKLNGQELIDFFFISEDLYKELNDLKKSAQYQRLYTNKVSELKEQGVIVNSYYDNGQ